MGRVRRRLSLKSVYSTIKKSRIHTRLKLFTIKRFQSDLFSGQWKQKARNLIADSRATRQTGIAAPRLAVNALIVQAVTTLDNLHPFLLRQGWIVRLFLSFMFWLFSCSAVWL